MQKILKLTIFKRDLALLVALLVESLKETKKGKMLLQKSVSYPLGTVVLTFLVSLAFPSALAPRGPSPPTPWSIPWSPSPQAPSPPGTPLGSIPLCLSAFSSHSINTSASYAISHNNEQFSLILLC